MMMTIADIQAGFKLLSIEEKQRVLALLLNDLAGDDEALKAKLTQEALDDVTAGRLIAHDDVKTWADSLETDHARPLPR
jgi:hypothetical protein